MGKGGGGGGDQSAAIASIQQMNQQLIEQMMNAPKGLTTADIMALMPDKTEVKMPDIEQGEAIDWTSEVETAQAKADAEQKLGTTRRPPLTYLDDDDEPDLTGSLLTGE